MKINIEQIEKMFEADVILPSVKHTHPVLKKKYPRV
jgi:hypothetical protein